MADTCAKLLKILRAELEDLLEDIAVIERRAAERFSREEITDYVYRENDGLFRLESEAIREIINYVDGVDFSLYKGCDDLCDALGSQIEHLVREHEDPLAVYGFFMRKLGKVRTYVESAD